MKGYLAFTKKEFLEQLRTYKLLVILAVFFLVGMTSPLLAKLLPEILSGMEAQGVKIVVSAVTVTDAYAQYFKNMTQIGMLVLLLVFGGTISNELIRGTLINIVSKGLPRHAVLLAKYTAAVSLWTAGYLLSAITAYGYSLYLFPGGTVVNLFFSMFCLWLFGCFLLALIFLSSTIAPGYFGGLILSGVVLIVLMTVNVLPDVVKYNPITLAFVNTALIAGQQDVADLVITVLITVSLTLICIALSISTFQKKKL